MAEPTENNLSTLYMPSVASTQPTIEEVAAENQRRRELDIEYGLTGGEYSSALANSQTGRPLSDKDLAFHLDMMSGDQSVAGTDQGTWTDYLQDIGNFIKNNPKALALDHNQTNDQVRTNASLTGPKTKFSVGRSRYEGGPSSKKFSLERDVGKGIKVTAGSEGGDKFANVQLTRDFKADGGELGTLNNTENGILQYLESVLAPENAKTFTEQQTGLGREGVRKYIPDPTQVADYLQDNKTYSIGPFGIDPEWLKSEFSYLEDIGDFIGNSSQGVADDLTKEGGLFGDTTFEREVANRRIDSGFDPEKYNTSSPEMSAINPDDRSIFSNLKGGGLNAVLLDKYPELADNPAFNLAKIMIPRTLGESAFDAATMYPPLFWMKALKPGSSVFRQANKHQRALDRLSQKKAEGNLSDSLMRRNDRAAKYHQSRIDDYVANYGTHTDKQLQDEMNLLSSSDPRIGPERRKFLENVERMADDRKSDLAGTGSFLGPNESRKLSDAAKVVNPQKALVDQSSTLKKGPESELMPDGFITTDEARDAMNKQFAPFLDNLADSMAPKKTDTDDLGIFELLERIKDTDPT